MREQLRRALTMWAAEDSRRARAPKKKLRRRWLALAAVPLLAAACCLTAPGKAVLAAATERQLPIYCVEKADNVCALSFDAAWGNEDTQQLIEILGAYDVKATFFVVGEWVDKYPESVRALFDAGHEIMNHSDDHPYFSKLSAEQITAQLNACNDKIEAVTGVRPTLFRPPYGDYNDRVVLTVRGLGMEPVQWDVDSLDWKDPTPAQITERVLKRTQPGSILLFHNAAKNTPAALPSILAGLLQKGYTLVPVSQLLLQGPYVMDHTGRQCAQ